MTVLCGVIAIFLFADSQLQLSELFGDVKLVMRQYAIVFVDGFNQQDTGITAYH